MQRSGFNVAYNGHNIWAIRTKSSGVTYSIEYLKVAAALGAGYKLEHFRELNGQDQSEIIAWLETSQQIAAVLSEAAQSESGTRT